MEHNESLTLDEIKKRVTSSFFSLTFRQIALRSIGFISINIILIRLLPLETIGIFNIANSIITFFAFFADVGLGASLIQKRGKVEHEDIKTTFTIQQLLVLVISLIIIAGAPYYATYYGMDESGIWLIRALGVSFLITSLKVIPAVLLERELRFQPLVMAEIFENIVFNLLLIVLVIQGFGIWSFSIAAVARAITGVVTIFILAPVRLGIGINALSARAILSYGIPFQLNSVLALIKDRLVPLVIAGMVGPIGISYITWSQSVAFLPLEIMQVVIRITFPAFSRLQDNTAALTKAVEKSLFVTSLAVFPFIFGLGAILPFIIIHLTSTKVQPALSSFYLFAFSTYWAVISTTLTNVLNAIGKIQVTLKLMIFWTILTWLLTPLLVWKYGFLGVSIASFIISFTSVLTIVSVKRFLNIQILNSIFLPTFASTVMAIIVYIFSLLFVTNALGIGFAVLLGIGIYSGIIFFFAKQRILQDLKSLRTT